MLIAGRLLQRMSPEMALRYILQPRAAWSLGVEVDISS